jgi:HD-like signal output (HDOD) protein
MTSALRDELQMRVDRLRTLPSSPAVLEPLLDLLHQSPEEIDIKKVVELVSYEKSIAAQCLRIANSPLYGRRSATESIHAAVLSLGIQRIEDILLSCCLNQLVPAKNWATDPAVFWRHSLGCALVCRELAERIELRDPEQAYLAGLLHDLGLLVNSVAYAAEYPAVVDAARKVGHPLHQLEQEMLGFTHCESGAILAIAWRLPASVAEVIEWHHDVEHGPEGNPLIALVHLGDLICRLRGLGYGYDEWSGVDLAADSAWAELSKHCPRLATMDLARFTLDMESWVARIDALVDAVFAPKRT